MIMGDPPKTFGIGFGLWTCRYKLLENITDVTADTPLLPTSTLVNGSITPSPGNLRAWGDAHGFAVSPLRRRGAYPCPFHALRSVDGQARERAPPPVRPSAHVRPRVAGASLAGALHTDPVIPAAMLGLGRRSPACEEADTVVLSEGVRAQLAQAAHASA